MTKFTIPIFSFILVSLLFTSCKGQIPTNQAKSETASNQATDQNPKIIRTQGTQSGVVGCELVDKDGNVWFSISGEGAYRYDGKTFTNFTTHHGLCNNYVGTIIQDQMGNILFGTNSGICKYDGLTFSTYPIPDTLSITCMLEDTNGNLWFGTKNNGIYRYNGKTLDNFLNSNQAYNLGNNNQFILDMLEDRNGNIWFCSWNGGGVWKFDGNNFTNFLPSAEYYTSNQDNRNFNKSQSTSSTPYSPSPDHITDDMIFSMTEDHSGHIWFATRDHGICRYDGNTFTTIGRNEGFNSGGATAILQVEDHSFWITTADTGVWHYNGKTFTNYTENDGLVNKAVMNMLKDKNGTLWFGTKYLGLSAYDGKTFRTFSYYDH
jgi:ligand-binding sensor domain-containing protein